MALKTIDINGASIRKEADAAAAITPGMLVERTSAGTVQAHSTATGNAEILFAHENDLHGSDIDTAYASGDRVQLIAPPKGGEVLAWLQDLETAVIGSFLDSNGDGTLKVVNTAVATADTERSSIVGVALEAKSPSGADVRIKIAII